MGRCKRYTATTTAMVADLEQGKLNRTSNSCKVCVSSCNE